MAILLWIDKLLFLVISVDEDLDRIRGLRLIVNPKKLAYMQTHHGAKARTKSI